MRPFAAALILASATMPLTLATAPAQTMQQGGSIASGPLSNPLSNQFRLGQPGGSQPAAPGPAAPAPAAPSSGLLSTITPDTTMRILKGAGFTDLELYKDGDSVAVKVTGSGVDSYVWHENCKNGQCVTLWFVCNYGKQEGVDSAFINDYNLNTIYTKMSISGSGDLLLSMAGSLYNGVSEAHVRSLGELWLSILKEAAEYKPKG